MLEYVSCATLLAWMHVYSWPRVHFCVPATQWACGSALSSFPTVCVPWALVVTSGQRYGRMPRSEVAGSLPVCQGWVWHGPVWITELSLWSLSSLTSLSLSLCLSLSGYVADAATGGARGFHHSNRGGAQCEGVCGEGLWTCGKDHCVSQHISILFAVKITDLPERPQYKTPQPYVSCLGKIPPMFNLSFTSPLMCCEILTCGEGCVRLWGGKKAGDMFCLDETLRKQTTQEVITVLESWSR